MRPTDPMEIIVADALDAAGVAYVTDVGGFSPANLDFYLPNADVHIEVKRMHSPRIAEQMSRAPNVIAVQGAEAVRWFAGILRAPSKALSVDDGAERVHSPETRAASNLPNPNHSRNTGRG